MKKNILNLFTTLLLLSTSLSSCGTQKEALAISDKEKEIFASQSEEPVEISDEKTEYEIIIIEPGFNIWLQSVARPEGYYSKSFLENRNQILVLNWNQRVLQPNRFNPNLYELQINYDPQIDYGYEVNYKLYNYFVFFQRRYNQRLGPFLPRI